MEKELQEGWSYYVTSYRKWVILFVALALYNKYKAPIQIIRLHMLNHLISLSPFEHLCND